MNNQKPWRFFSFWEGGDSCLGSNAGVEVSTIESQELQQENVGFFRILIIYDSHCCPHSHTIRAKAMIPRYLIWIQSSNVNNHIIVYQERRTLYKQTHITNQKKHADKQTTI